MIKNKAENQQHQLLTSLKELLSHSFSGTQEALCQTLKERGINITQSALSRVLRKMGAIKSVNSEGYFVYNLPLEPKEPGVRTRVNYLVTAILASDTLIVVKTAPGSASLIGSILDHHQPANILGTIAGDDTVLVIPRHSSVINETILKIQELLQ